MLLERDTELSYLSLVVVVVVVGGAIEQGQHMEIRCICIRVQKKA